MGVAGEPAAAETPLTEGGTETGFRAGGAASAFPLAGTEGGFSVATVAGALPEVWAVLAAGVDVAGVRPFVLVGVGLDPADEPAGDDAAVGG